MTEDEMVGWHHLLKVHEFEYTPGVGDGQGGMACCDSWGRKESDTTEQLHFTIIFPDNIPGGSVGKEFTCNTGDPGPIPGSGRSLGEGNGNPLQYSCLENPMDQEAW